MAEMIQPAMVPKVKLYTGEEIPCVGMGTFGSDRFTPEQVSNAVAGAIRCGYRMFDCAACYGNEDQIGEVFHAAFEEGVVERKDLFIMTKVWNDMHEAILGKKKASEFLKKADFVDEYRGKQIPQGKKSVTIRLTIGSNEKTLTSQEIENVANQVMKKLQKKMGAELRTQ